MVWWGGFFSGRGDGGYAGRICLKDMPRRVGGNGVVIFLSLLSGVIFGNGWGIMLLLCMSCRRVSGVGWLVCVCVWAT